LHWKDETFITKFYESLKKHVKDKIAKKNRFKELTKYIEYMI